MNIRTKNTFQVFLMVLSLLALPPVEAFAEVQRKYQRSVETYAVPEVTLVDQDGKKIKLSSLLDSRDAVLLDFVFTTCTTICPVLTSGFSSFQHRLGPEAGHVQLVSIAIDPDNDTPKAMKAYIQKYGGQPGWNFLTGSRSDIVRVQKAFNTYTPDKMSHPPVILLKSRSDKGWVRIYGLIGTADLVTEYKKILR